MPEQPTDFDAEVADLLRRGLEGVQPTIGAEEVARQAMTAGRVGPGWLRVGVSAVAAVVLVGVVLLVSGRGSVGGGPSESLHLSGYTLRYPAAWDFHPVDFSPSFFTIPGYIASGPFSRDAICQAAANGISCDENAFGLEPGDVVIKIKDWSPPFAEPAAEPAEQIVRVDGMPAFYSESRAGGELGTAILTWRIRVPEAPGSLLILEAHLRGPGMETLEAEVRAMVESLHWDNPPRELPTDAATLARVVRGALATLSQQDRSFRCFPMPGETVGATVANLPFQGSLRDPLAVTCATRLDESDARVWKLGLTMSWDEGGYAGSFMVSAYVNVDGEVGSTTSQSEGELPPMLSEGSTPAPSPSESSPAGAGRASWALPADAQIGASTTQFTALVTEEDCASGHSAEGRVLGPEIQYTADAVIVTFQVRPLEGTQTCQYNPRTPVQVTLTEPLGDRQLLDGDCDPPRQPQPGIPGGYCD